MPWMINKKIIWNNWIKNAMNYSLNQMSLQFISISGCDSQSLIISVWPFAEAKSNGVSLNIALQCQKQFAIEIEWNTTNSILQTILHSNFLFVINVRLTRFYNFVDFFEISIFGGVEQLPREKEINSINKESSIESVK